VAESAAAISDAGPMFRHALAARLRLDPERHPGAQPSVSPSAYEAGAGGEG